MAGVTSGKICIFGAGGPVGVAATWSLAPHYTLRLTDVRSVEHILEHREPQDEGAPLPSIPESPHEWRVVDVFDYDQVLDAARGMDALVNCAVVRDNVTGAFRVNTVGAYNVMKAAVECGIRRVIHTGPRRPRSLFEEDYWHLFGIPDDVPFRVGSHLYGITKHLGDQVVRTFAETHGLEVICFLYCWLAPSDGGNLRFRKPLPFGVVSWEDAGEAFLCGLRVDSLPRSYEVFNIIADLPHGVYSPKKAQGLLGWRPKHNFEELYRM